MLSALLLFAPLSAKADATAQWRPIIAKASTRFCVPTSWIERVMHAESRGLTTLNGRPIRSRAGAIGLMQLMPATWNEMRARLALGSDPDDPHDNILAGTLYLRLMYDRFGYPGVFGAYNAGPAVYAAWLAGTRRLPQETSAYLRSFVDPAPLNLAANASPPPPSIFFIRRPSPIEQSPVIGGEHQASLFAIRKVAP